MIQPENRVSCCSSGLANRFEGFQDDPTEVELVFVEFRPIDGRAVGHAAELVGREAAAERVLDVDEAITGQRISKELPAAVTVLRSVGFAAAVGIGTLR